LICHRIVRVDSVELHIVISTIDRPGTAIWVAGVAGDQRDACTAD
jgi:hypothetical protein